MQLLDASGKILASGERFQVAVVQGEKLTLHIYGKTAADGTRGYGAYTLDIDTLPQVVSAVAESLLLGPGELPGGATASLVITLQGDRLDPATAQNANNYAVTWAGPDGIFGTADDELLPAPSASSMIRARMSMSITARCIRPPCARPSPCFMTRR